MANGSNINLLCDELEILLKDICTFLNDETIDKVLPQPKKLNAKLLLKRSNRQLESLRCINKIRTEAALKTHATASCSRGVHRRKSRASISSNVLKLKEVPNSSHEDCKFPDLFEAEVVNGKSGPLHFHKKTFCFQKMKKVFVIIFRHWFIIYSNESASKPLHVINLTKYQSSACADLPYNVKKKEKSFDLIPMDESTSFRFTADSSCDMVEWVTAINHSFERYQPCLESSILRHTYCTIEDCNISTELTKNKTQASEQQTLRYQLQEAPSIKSIDSSDDEKYITVLASSSTDSLPSEENGDRYDTLERINKRMSKEKQEKEDQKKYIPLANNFKLIAMDIESYWSNKEKSPTNK